MKRILYCFLGLLSIAAVLGCKKEENLRAYEVNARKLYGEYRLESIHWAGMSVDLGNYTGGKWDLLEDFRKKVGYCEDDYGAIVKAGSEMSSYGNVLIRQVWLNISVPLPYYSVVDGKWHCSRIREMKLPLRTPIEYVTLYSPMGYTNPKFNDPNDVFLSGIDAFSAVVSSFDDGSFEFRMHCIFPHNEPNGQQLNDDYLSFKFVVVR